MPSKTVILGLWPVLLTLVFGFDQVPLQSAPYGCSKTIQSKWTVFNHTIKRVAVIGAGPAGLQAAAGLVAENFTVRLFERAPAPGGNWFYTEETPVRESYPDKPIVGQRDVPSVLPATRYYVEGDDGLSLDYRWREHWKPRPIWHSLHTNSPAVITELADVPYLPDHKWVISAHIIQNHVRAYASVHRLNVDDYPIVPGAHRVASYSTRVEKLVKSDDGKSWVLTLRRLERLQEPNRIKATWWQEEFDAVFVATGPYESAHVPEINGLVEWSKVRNDGSDQHSVYHSQNYRRPERYQGKTVLVLGVGTSGSEIARDIDPYAKKLYASVKSSHQDTHPFQRRSIRRFPESIEFIPEIESFGPISSYTEGITAGVIKLANGTALTGVDEVILATGYRRTNPFLAAILNGTEEIQARPPSDIFNGNPLKNLHWTGHYIPDPTLAFSYVRPWTLGPLQALAVAKVWRGTAHIPNEEELWRQYNDTTGRWNNFRGLFGTLPSEAIVRQLVAWLNNESLEHGGRFVSAWPLEKREVFAYYANLEWERDYISSENFTQVENLPAAEWGSAYARECAWEAVTFDDEFW